MSMRTYITGFVSPDGKTYKKHLKVLMACIEADIDELPKETAEYFGSKYPDEELIEGRLEVELDYEEWSNESSQGFELLVSKIPEGTYKIRFANCY